MHGIEHTHNGEILIERLSPLFDVVALADQIDERHARAPCPLQHLHLKLVFRAVRLSSVNNVENTRPIDHGLQQRTFVTETTVIRVHADELFDQPGPLVGFRRAGLQPIKNRLDALKPRRIDQHVVGFSVQPKDIPLCLAGSARRGSDRNTVVFSKRRNDRAFAFVRVSYHREGRNHEPAPITNVRRRRTFVRPHGQAIAPTPSYPPRRRSSPAHRSARP